MAERCIYGVDMDPLAVELARLSLWLFASGPGAPLQLTGRHLRCGNSLLGEGLTGTSGSAQPGTGSRGGGVGCTRSSAISLQPFHWAKEFPEVSRGFDAVIGNPPYVSFSGRQKCLGNEWVAHVIHGDKPRGWLSTHGLFMLRSMELASESGVVSMVVQTRWVTSRGMKRSGHRCSSGGGSLRFGTGTRIFSTA